MPPIKVQHVISCSSEDRVHNAQNILVSDHYRKWKSAQTGEKQITLLLQLEKSSVFHSVDIGNEGSAFVEILVGRSSDPKQEFHVLIVSSSFMTPAESRQNTNTNRVRMFGPENLSAAVSKEKWDLVKIVCTQPFNKTTQYGLSFIVFHSVPDKTDAVKPESESQTSLGAFKIKSEDDSESSIRVGNWFAKRKNDNEDVDSLSTPSAIKSATLKPKNSQSEITKKVKLTSDDNHNSRSSTSSAKKLNADSKSKGAIQERGESSSFSQNQGSSGQQNSKNESKQLGSDTVQTKRKLFSKEADKKRIKPNVPFRKLLEGTVFALSGYQNPKRGEIRDKAIEMGAVYETDWNRRCTHLVCAFLNTPKFNQVHKQGGRIVKESWIFECHKQKKSLPWRQFMLGKSNRPETSESEDTDNEIQPSSLRRTPSPNVPSSSESVRNTNRDKRISHDQGNSLNGSNFSSFKTGRQLSKKTNDVDVKSVYLADTDADSDSGCDTETEIGKVIDHKTSSKPNTKQKPDTKNLDLPELPNIFQNEHFYMYGNFGTTEKKSLIRYIIGCGGVVEEYMSSSVLYVLTNSKWSQDFTDAVTENSSLRILKPSWVTDSIDKGKVLPKRDYFVHRR